jgi:hypothetical protein
VHLSHFRPKAETQQSNSDVTICHGVRLVSLSPVRFFQASFTAVLHRYLSRGRPDVASALETDQATSVVPLNIRRNNIMLY